MLLFYLMIYRSEKRYNRYLNLSEKDKDNIMTFFGVIECLIIWVIAVNIIIRK